MGQTIWTINMLEFGGKIKDDEKQNENCETAAYMSARLILFMNSRMKTGE